MTDDHCRQCRRHVATDEYGDCAKCREANMRRAERQLDLERERRIREYQKRADNARPLFGG